MDDGTYSFKKRKYINYRFSTNSFPLEDQQILVQALKDNFSIHAKIHKERYSPTLRWFYIPTLSVLSIWYALTCFDYKIQNN